MFTKSSLKDGILTVVRVEALCICVICFQSRASRITKECLHGFFPEREEQWILFLLKEVTETLSILS